MSVSVDDFVKAVTMELNKYADVAPSVLYDAVLEASKEAVAELNMTSPYDTGAYARSWNYKKPIRQKATFIYGVVYNKDHYRLTHLLENGHLIVSGPRAGERTQSFPHIAEAEDNALETMELLTRKGL